MNRKQAIREAYVAELERRVCELAKDRPDYQGDELSEALRGAIAKRNAEENARRKKRPQGLDRVIVAAVGWVISLTIFVLEILRQDAVTTRTLMLMLNVSAWYTAMVFAIVLFKLDPSADKHD